MLSVISWKWTPYRHYRSTYPPATVNTLKRMVARHYPQPHRFFCVTDDPTGIDADVEIIPIWNDFAQVPSPHDVGMHRKNPSCYRRLRLFKPDIAAIFGSRFVSIDLDTVILGDLQPLWNRPEDLVMWGDTNPKTHYNGSMMLMTAGCRPHVWEQFNPRVSPRIAMKAGCWGSDQGWISYCLGPGEATWTRDDGVYSFRNDIQAKRSPLPSNARMVMFHGRHDPWQAPIQKIYPWVREAYK